MVIKETIHTTNRGTVAIPKMVGELERWLFAVVNNHVCVIRTYTTENDVRWDIVYTKAIPTIDDGVTPDLDAATETFKFEDAR